MVAGDDDDDDDGDDDGDDDDDDEDDDDDDDDDIMTNRCSKCFLFCKAFLYHRVSSIIIPYCA